MAAAKAGDTVKVHYTGKLGDGTVFDSSSGREPLEFTLGQRRLIPGFEEAVLGMQPGESKIATVTPEQGYGERKSELIVEFDRASLPAEVNVDVGSRIQLQTNTGQPVPATVIESGDQKIKVDANHPLAGKELTFDVELVEIVGGL